jgi:M6 family metalloprotease-like protein
MRMYLTGAQGFKNLSVFVSPVIIAIICLFFSVSGASAQGSASTSGSSHESERAAQVRALNNGVLQLHGQMQENASGTSGIHSQAAIVLAQRAAALRTLIQEDPHAALTFAFSPELLADLATKFPDSAAQLESHITLSGAIEHWIFDSADVKSSKESWFMNAGGSRLTLHFSSTIHPDPKAGPVVTIEGVQVGSDIAVSKVSSAAISGAAGIFPQFTNFSFSQRAVPLAFLLVGSVLLISLRLTSRTVRQATWGSSATGLLRQLAVCTVALLVVVSSPTGASAQTCSTIGVQNVAVLLVSFSDIAVPLSPQQVTYDFFGGNGGASLTGYWQEASYGQTSATGNVYPLTVGASASYSCSTVSQIFYDAVTAAKAQGIDLTPYQRINIVFPDLNCYWSGFTSTGSIGAGCNIWSTAEGTLTASISYNSARYMSTQGQAVGLIAHENGHQLGLEHAGTITDEPTAVLGAPTSPGTIGEFNDFFSTMGNSTLTGHYVAPDKAEILNWLAPNTNYNVVTTSGAYTLQPFESSPPGLKALKVQRGSGNAGYYLWVEYRQPVGYDSSTYTYLGFMNYSGALIHYETPNLSSFGSSVGHRQVMDFTPSDVGSWYNTVLAPGQTWTDPYSDVSISVSSATSNGVTVSVSYSGASSCTSSAPSVSASPLNPSIYPGQTASYSVSITNNDSSGCSYSTINLGSTEPSGWSSSFSSPSVTLGPGQSASVTMGKGAPTGTPAGTYAVNLTAANTAASTTDTANATVVTMPTLAVSVSISGTSFVRPGTVPITASVTSGGTPSSGAGVTFTLTAPNGSTTTQTATTGSNGTATWNYKLNAKSPAGTYSVAAQASLSSGSKKAASTQAVASNTATFSVQ